MFPADPAVDRPAPDAAVEISLRRGTKRMGQLEEMNASLAAMKASLKAIERQNAATRVDELAAVVVKQNAELRAAMIQQHAELRQDVIKQNADNAVLMLKQTAALIAAVQEQTKAIEKLAAPAREREEEESRGDLSRCWQPA